MLRVTRTAREGQPPLLYPIWRQKGQMLSNPDETMFVEPAGSFFCGRHGDAERRRDFLHKTTISQNHAMVCIEDLQVRNMSRSAAGTTERPGRKVR